MARIAGVGDNVVDCYFDLATMFPGGNCLNVAVFARRLGHQSAYVGAVAKDAAGDAICIALDEEDVATDRLRVLPQGRTAHCVIGLDQGERVFLSSGLGVSRFTPDAADVAYLRDFDAVHVGQSSGLEAHLAVLADGARLSYDFSTRHDHPQRDAILAHCFLATFSGGGLTEADAEALAGRAVAHGAQWVLVTRGSRGAMLARRHTRFTVPAAPCRVVDTLGAGDAFIAAALSALLDGVESPDVLLSRAATLAARTCEHHGGIGHPVPLHLPA